MFNLILSSCDLSHKKFAEDEKTITNRRIIIIINIFRTVKWFLDC